MASVQGALGLQLSNARRKLLVAQFLRPPMLLRDANVAALNWLAVYRVAYERLRCHVAIGGLLPAGKRHLVQLSRVSIKHPHESRAYAISFLIGRARLLARWVAALSRLPHHC